MRGWMSVLLSVLLFLAMSLPVWADDGEGQAVFPGETFVIGPGEEVNGDVVVMGGNLELQQGGRANGDVAILGGSAIIDGEVDGHLVVVGGTLDLRSRALIRENLVTFGASVSRAPGATVQGETIEGFRGRMLRLPTIRIGRITRTREWDTHPFFSLVGGFVRFVLSLMALIALGVLLVLLLPQQTAVVGQAINEAGWTSFAVGLLTLLVLIMLVPLLVIICIGIPVAILLLIAATAAGLFGWTAIAALLGQRLMASLRTAQVQPVVEVILGVLLITVVSQLPCLGWLIAAIAATTGLGAVVLTRFGTMRYSPQRQTTDAPAPPAPEPGPTGSGTASH